MLYLRTVIVTLLILASACASQKHIKQAEVDGEGLRLEMAEIFIKKGSHMAAVPLLRRVLSEDPENIEARVLYGQVLRRQGLHGQALAQLKLAAEKAPKYAPAYAGLGIVFDVMQEPKKAHRAHLRAVSLDRRNADYWNNLGFSLFVAGDIESSIQALERALALNPSLTVAYNNLGFAYARRGDDEAALRSFRSAVGEARAYLNLAMVMDERNQAGRADEYRNKAFAIEPSLKEQKR